jgi:hypothetical protein
MKLSDGKLKDLRGSKCATDERDPKRTKGFDPQRCAERQETPCPQHQTLGGGLMQVNGPPISTEHSPRESSLQQHREDIQNQSESKISE